VGFGERKIFRRRQEKAESFKVTIVLSLIRSLAVRAGLTNVGLGLLHDTESMHADLSTQP
jgi:hypothetical protein